MELFDVFKGTWWGFLLEILICFYSFVGLGYVCDDYMVPALETLCVRWQIPEDVAGATFMAFGSAAPEIIINVVQLVKNRISEASKDSGAEHDTHKDAVTLGLGAIIGSGMIAFMVIPAICALSAAEVLEIKRRPMARDFVFYAASLFATIMALRDNKIEWWEPLILVCLYIAFVLTVICGRRVRGLYMKATGRVLLKQESFVIREQKRRELEKNALATSTGTLTNPLLADEKPEGETSTQGVVTYWVRSKNNPARKGIRPSQTQIANEKALSVQNEYIGKTSPASHYPDLRAKNQDIESSQSSMQAHAGSTASVLGNIESPRPPVIPEGEKFEEEDEEPGLFGRIFGWIKWPLDLLFTVTCPHAGPGERFEYLYPLSFIISFAWIAGFSFVIAEIVEQWVRETHVSQAFFGVTLIAIGAEIPDTIQSVSVAKRNYGSMAISNCIGSQIVNLCIGLGLSWLIGILVTPGLKPITLTSSGVRNTQVAAICQGGAVVWVTLLMFCPVLCCGDRKIYLGRHKGVLLLLSYVVTIGAFAGWEAYLGEL